MQGYFKIPVKDTYVDIDISEDTPINLLYDENMEFGYVLLRFQTIKDNWQSITQEEFEAKQAELMPLEIDAD